jgi:hypothetical protein
MIATIHNMKRNPKKKQRASSSSLIFQNKLDRRRNMNENNFMVIKDGNNRIN